MGPMPVRRCEHAVDFVREIMNHEHRDWVRVDDPKTSSWGLECRVCESRYLIAIAAFRYQGGDRYSNALRPRASRSNPQEPTTIPRTHARGSNEYLILSQKILTLTSLSAESAPMNTIATGMRCGLWFDPIRCKEDNDAIPTFHL